MNRFVTFAITLSLTMLAACSEQEQPGGDSGAATADIVITNATVHTMNPAQPSAEAIAVRGNKIVYVGSADGAAELVGDETEVLDADGKMVLPGFISAHDHLIASRWLQPEFKLFEYNNRQEVLDAVVAYGEANPDLPVILGVGWSPAKLGGMPSRADLDALFPDRPVLLIDASAHEGWFNSAALRESGVPADAPDRQPGITYWVRDDNGEMTGLAYEFQWLDLYLGLGLWNLEEQLPGLVSGFQNLMPESGMTTFLAPGIALPSTATQDGQIAEFEYTMNYLAELKAKGQLNSRVFASPMLKGATTDIEELTEFAAQMAAQYDGDYLGVRGVKIHPEAGITTMNAPFLTPYEGTDITGNFGVSPERMLEMTMAANERDLDIYIHVEGNATVRAAIDAFEASIEAGYQTRNSLHHLAFVTPEDYQRIVDLDILVNATPQFSTTNAGQGVYLPEMLGEKRVNEQAGMYTDLAHDGVTISIAADVPSTPPSMVGPLYNMQVAMTITDPSDENAVPFPASRKRLTLDQALLAVTIDAAKFLRLEDVLGSLEEGKLADIVVLGQDLRDVPADQIKDVPVNATIVDGQFRHREGI